MKGKPKAPKRKTESTQTLSSKATTQTEEDGSTWIRTERTFSLPDHLKEVIQRLNEAGHVAYVVGGSVRDFLLGRESKDDDIATSAKPDELLKIFPDGITFGIEFGVVKIPVKKGDEHPSPILEIATFREDLKYRDHRHPEGVVFKGPREDASRRDFTINGLFYDPKTQNILDFVGGYKDLKAGLVRAIGDPHKRFEEDALRLLRGIRFTSNLGFVMDPSTSEAIKSKAKFIQNVSRERICDELTKMWIGPSPHKALRLLSEHRLLEQILPELETLKGVRQLPEYRPDDSVWTHTERTLEALARQQPHKRSASLSWAALLLNIGKPLASEKSKGRNFNQHEIFGAEISEKICRRLQMSNDQTRAIVWMVSDQLKFREVFSMRESTLIRWLRQENFNLLLEVHRADAIASDGNLASYEFCKKRYDELAQQPLPRNLIDGEDLIALGLKPGRQFSKILETIENLALEHQLSTKEEALEYVIKNFVQ